MFRHLQPVNTYEHYSLLFVCSVVLNYLHCQWKYKQMANVPCRSSALLSPKSMQGKQNSITSSHWFPPPRCLPFSSYMFKLHWQRLRMTSKTVKIDGHFSVLILLDCSVKTGTLNISVLMGPSVTFSLSVSDLVHLVGFECHITNDGSSLKHKRQIQVIYSFLWDIVKVCTFTETHM